MVTHIVTVQCGNAYRSIGIPAGFMQFHPLVQFDTFAILQHRAKEMGPVKDLVWTACPDPAYKPPSPKQLGLF